jgi:hypothetical protein
LTAAYSVSGSVHVVAALFGMCGQSVQERLVKAGIPRSNPRFSDTERDRLLTDYANFANAGKLDELAAEMGRTRQFLCRQAKVLGLTNRSHPAPWNDGTVQKAWHAVNAHPRGMLGKHHTEAACVAIGHGGKLWRKTVSKETLLAIRLKSDATRQANGTIPAYRTTGSWKAGWREFGGKRTFFRSRWEANYGRYLQWLKEKNVIADWEHEPITFWFEKIRRGVRSYLPDFRVTELNGSIAYHEVKGWMDKRSRTTIHRMAIYHKKVKLIVIEKKTYYDIEDKVSRLIVGWEFGARK